MDEELLGQMQQQAGEEDDMEDGATDWAQHISPIKGEQDQHRQHASPRNFLIQPRLRSRAPTPQKNTEKISEKEAEETNSASQHQWVCCVLPLGKHETERVCGELCAVSTRSEST